eukprot:6195111-Pleurochrysis_carterae.AAC.3
MIAGLVRGPLRDTVTETQSHASGQRVGAPPSWGISSRSDRTPSGRIGQGAFRVMRAHIACVGLMLGIGLRQAAKEYAFKINLGWPEANLQQQVSGQ